VRVDESVLKLLACVEVVAELADVAMRGARYGFPGWVTETTQKNGKNPPPADRGSSIPTPANDGPRDAASTTSHRREG
jgi:hypothetical protein